MPVVYTTTLTHVADLHGLYDRLGWNESLQLQPAQLAKAMVQSWHVIYVYDQEKLIGTGRVVSDGIINAYLCGVGVDPAFQGMGLGREISKRLIEHCRSHQLHIQLLCEDRLVSYYQEMGFDIFAVGMKLKE